MEMVTRPSKSSRWFGSIQSFLRLLWRPSAETSAKKRPGRYTKLNFDCLEDRLAPALITVNSVVDTNVADASVSLREAILLVNGTLGRSLTATEQAQVSGTLGSNDTIQFNLPSGPQTITLTSGALNLTKSATINGPGAANLTINGNNADRVFVIGKIFSKNLSQVDALNGLSIAGGKQTYGAGVLNFGTLTLNNCVLKNNVGGTSGGGGIYNVGALTLSNSTITANSVGQSTNGGGLYNIGGSTATVTNCTFSKNSAGGSGSTGSSGGAVYSSGTITFTGCTFDSNTAGSDAGAFFTDGTATATSCAFTNNYSGADGGALHATGTFTITNCLISGNTASSSGGGMEESTGTKLTVTNTTFANNLAYGTAGGLVNWGAGVTLTNVTFTGNRAINGASGTYGGGIWDPRALTLQNCIVAGNFKGTGTATSDVSGNVVSTSSYNLIGGSVAGGLTNGVNHNQVGINAGLGVLGNNGGPLATVPLLPGSPAINQGSNALVAAGATDQRGFTRIINGTVDIGAFESQVSSTATGNQTGAQGVSGTYSLGSFNDAGPTAGPWTVDVNWGDGTAHTIFTTTSKGTLPSQSHVYAQSGTLTATVAVTDPNHDASQATFQVTVSPTVATSLVVAGFPTLVTTAVAGTFMVTVMDNNGLTANSYGGKVHFTSTDPQAVLPADYTFVAADNGQHTFSATLKTVGIQSITATDTVTASITGTQSGIQVNSAAPAVITVNSLADNNIADGNLTVREAVLLTNGTLGRALTAAEQAQLAGTLGNSNTIQFNLPAGPQTITLAAGPLSLTNSVTISGPGAANLTINGNNLDRVFIIGQIWSPNPSQVVSISGLTVSGGNQVYGGGLLNFGTLTINNCVVSGNSAGGSGGGGIYNVTSLTVTNSTFSGNTVSQLGNGGALENISSGTVTAIGCTFTGNSAAGTGSSASSGAAIGNSGTLIISSSTLSNNSAGSNGGGIYNDGTLTVTACSIVNNTSGADGGGIDQDGTATVTNTTFAGNFAASEGGAMDNIGTLTMSNSTLYGNTAVSDGGGLATSGPAQLANCTITANRVTHGSNGLFGGGIYAPSTPPRVFNTIVAGNFQGADPSTTPDDIAGTVDATSAFNLIGAGGSGGMVDGTNNNQVGVTSLGLGALASNGGATQTVALLPGSPAIDTGSNAYVTAGATDQRGLARIVNSTVDIGAYEVQTTSTPPANQVATVGVAANFNLGAFADASNSGPWTISINWGDSSPVTTFNMTTQGSLGVQAHTYQLSGVYSVLVTVTDANNDTSQALFQVVVS